MKKILLAFFLSFLVSPAIASYTNSALHSVTFLTSGIWKAPPGVGQVRITGCSGGGGGGWAANTGSLQGGGGGGSSAYWIEVATNVTPGTSYSINIGAGGVGGSSNPVAARPGTAGSSTTFNGLEIEPGRGGFGITGGDGGGLLTIVTGGVGGPHGFAGESSGIKSTYSFTFLDGGFYPGAGGGAGGNNDTAYKGGDWTALYEVFNGGIPSSNRAGGGAAGPHGDGTPGKTAAAPVDADDNSCAGGGGLGGNTGAGVFYRAGNGGSGRLTIYYIGP